MELFFPNSLTELWDLLTAYPGGRVAAGGTDLLVKLRHCGQEPPALFWLEHLTELRTITVEAGEVVIGAAVTHQEIIDHPLVREGLAVLGQALAELGSPPIRHAATLGGNICTASPAGDSLPPLYVLEAMVELTSLRGRRILPIAAFILGPGRTVLEPGEILTRIRIPLPAVGVRSAYYKVGKRKALAIAIASLAILVQSEPDGCVKELKLAWGSLGPTIITLPEVTAFLTGKVLSEMVLREAGAIASRLVSPITDVRASAAYRRLLAGNLLMRLLEV